MKVSALTYIRCHQNSKPCKVLDIHFSAPVTLARKMPMKLFIYKINLHDAGVENTVPLHIISLFASKNKTGRADKFVYLTTRHGCLKVKGISFIHKSSSHSILHH